MISYILIVIGLLLVIGSYIRILYPWNNVSMKFGSIIILLGLLAFIASPITTVETVPKWNVAPLPTSSDGWGQLNGVWNENKDMMVVPIRITDDNDYRENNTRIPFEIKPNPPEIVKKDDYTTINIKITNYSTILNNHYLLKRTKGAFWANITDPSGVGSGDGYKKSYEMKYNEQGTFYIDFKLNPGSATLNTIGKHSDVQIHIYDNNNFYKTYTVRFICVED